MKRLLVKLFIMTMIIFMVVPSVSANSMDSSKEDSKELSISEIQKEFETNIEKDLQVLNGAELKELEVFYSQYNDLSADDKNLFIEYISSEELMNAIFNTGEEEIQLNAEDGAMKSIMLDHTNSDLPEGAEVEIKLVNAPSYSEGENTLTDERYTAWYEKTVSTLGIKIMVHRSEVKYKITKKGGKITGTYGSDHYMKRNFTVNDVRYSGQYTDSGNTYAESGANVKFHLISKYIPLLGPYKSGECQVRVTNKGKVTGYLREK